MKDARNRNRVVVTGLGAITPLGLNVDQYWQGLVEGRSGIGRITHFDPSNLSCKVAGEVKGFDPVNFMERKEARHMGRFSQFAIAAVGMAVEDAELNLLKEDPERLGVYLGNGIGGLPEIEDGCRTLTTRGGMRLNPFFMPIILTNLAAGHVSIAFGLKGYTSTVSTACAAATQAIGEAAEVIRRGSAEVMVAGGTEAGITAIGIAGFAVMKALTSRNEEPTKASRPFDANRDGFVPAEGAGVLVLESLEHATSRGAPILAELAGFGISSDAYHAVAIDSDGAMRAMRSAIEDAGLAPSDIDYINAHGTSTPLNDVSETRAIKRLFGDHAYKVSISSTKSMIGHLLGAAGGVEAIACVKTLNEGIVHPTINYETPDPECDLDYVPNVASKRDVRVVLSNSFGFGGQNACLVFRRF
ncbi:MAG: 3-oxoacyl-(acyl-carrier-protein) synthase 2 [Dehalococcoidia bacterium]|nr:3-oxoacyl-(acyl-carrier-protein) synthase 2 [Chloroflexota bacterium]MBT9159851.1 3-oxoacyl-(acyl-carrier-protein) synthase 2 [Chloroflexota bacterium]